MAIQKQNGSTAIGGEDSEPIRVRLNLQTNGSMVPWFNYRMNLPSRPLPSLDQRPTIKTRRLIVRPLLSSDLDALHELRRQPSQHASRLRGRPAQDKEETRRYLELLNEDPEDLEHWYFGAFLASTGELIAEAGLLDCNRMSTSLSGWPEAEFLVKPEYWRQGYGTELFHAVMNSWWDLPREHRRVQLIPDGMPGKEPGDDAVEGVVFEWEQGNTDAEGFFTKVLEGSQVYVSGTAVSFDSREGREGNLVTWTGLLVVNPRTSGILSSES